MSLYFIIHYDLVIFLSVVMSARQQVNQIKEHRILIFLSTIELLKTFFHAVYPSVFCFGDLLSLNYCVGFFVNCMPTTGLNVDKQDCWHFVFSIYHLNSNSHFSCYIPDCIYYFTYKVTTL